MCELSGAKAEIVGDKPRGCGGKCKAAKENLPCPLLQLLVQQAKEISNTNALAAVETNSKQYKS